MGVMRSELEAVREYHPSLVSVRSHEIGGQVNAARAEFEGRRGGRGGILWWSPKRRVVFRVIIDLRNFGDDHVFPSVWVESPTDPEIRHANIYPRPSSIACPFITGGPVLPTLCVSQDIKNIWSREPKSRRTLGAALEYLREHLSHQYLNDPARR